MFQKFITNILQDEELEETFDSLKSNNSLKVDQILSADVKFRSEGIFIRLSTVLIFCYKPDLFSLVWKMHGFHQGFRKMKNGYLLNVDQYQWEAATRGIFEKKLFLKGSPYSQENTCVEIRVSSTCVFLWILRKL